MRSTEHRSRNFCSRQTSNGYENDHWSEMLKYLHCWVNILAEFHYHSFAKRVNNRHSSLTDQEKHLSTNDETKRHERLSKGRGYSFLQYLVSTSLSWLDKDDRMLIEPQTLKSLHLMKRFEPTVKNVSTSIDRSRIRNELLCCCILPRRILRQDGSVCQVESTSSLRRPSMVPRICRSLFVLLERCSSTP